MRQAGFEPPTGNCTLRRLPTPGPVIYDLGDRLPRRYAAVAPHHHLGECPNEPQGFHTHRAVDRGGDHRHLGRHRDPEVRQHQDRKSTRLNSSHVEISYAVFCLKKKKKKTIRTTENKKKQTKYKKPYK